MRRGGVRHENALPRRDVTLEQAAGDVDVVAEELHQSRDRLLDEGASVHDVLDLKIFAAVACVAHATLMSTQRKSSLGRVCS
jgi:hypothetical protein